MAFILIFMALIMLSTGIFLLLSNKWLPKLSTLMWSTPPQPSTRLSILIWKYRFLGTFNIVLSIAMFIMIVSPTTNSLLPIYIAAIALLLNFVLGLVALALPIKNKKIGSDNS